MNESQIKNSKALLGKDTVEMLFKVHEDAMWVLENLGMGTTNPEIIKIFEQKQDEGLVFIHENRIYITKELIENCLKTTKTIDEFFVPKNSFFIGGTAPYVYDDVNKKGGIFPKVEHIEKLAKLAESKAIISGMGRGVKLKDDLSQLNAIIDNCSKPVYFSITTDVMLKRAVEIYETRKNIMAVFCLTRPPLEVNENFSSNFVNVVKAGLPVFISAMPLAGISAPYCYSGVLTMTHAEVLFGICLAQIINPGNICIHAGYPTIADPQLAYNPNYGTISHNVCNLLMSHLNMMLDMPTCQSGCTTHEENVTEKSLLDAKTGQAIFVKYGFHMIRHAFGFLRYLIDFSFEKFEKAAEIAMSVTSKDAPEIIMPAYDERGLESIKRIGLDYYQDDPLTTANIGKEFV